MAASSEKLEAVLGHRFQDRQLLIRALTHRSAGSDRDRQRPERIDNEQLEFLGDAVLGFLVSEALLLNHRALPEGHLSKLKSRLVSSSHLYQIAVKLDLGEYLILGRGEELSGGREKRALLADALEALIAALYLDGGIEVTRHFVLNHIISSEELLPSGLERDYADAKSALQELAQSLKLPQPRYHVLQETGPDHRKQFTIEVRVGKTLTAIGEAGSKKGASQKAAESVLRQLAGGEAPE